MIGLYATYSVMFMWYRLHALLRGNLTRASRDEWMNVNTEGDWQTEERENHWTKTYSKPEFEVMLRQAGFSELKIEQSVLQIKVIPIFGKLASVILPDWVGDLRVGNFGSMLVATCKNLE